MRRLNAGARNPDRVNPIKLEMDSVKALQFIKHNNPRSKSSRNFLSSCSKSNIFIVSIIAVFFSIVFFIVYGYWSKEDSSKFRIVIDGGSTGTRIHVFEYKVEEDGVPKFDFGPGGLGSMRVTPGLSTYVDFPEEAGGSLMELLEFGKRRGPEMFWKETEIRLMAPISRFEVAREDYGVVPESSELVRGSDEGLYAWVVANYALGSLGGDPKQTTGIIELGGASAQMTFVSNETLPSVFSRKLNYGNATYTLYSHSLLQFGQMWHTDSMKELIVSGALPSPAEPIKKGLVIDPCTPKRYSGEEYAASFDARGNFSDCKAAALAFLQHKKEDCTYQHCSVGSTFIPKIDGKFLATENFFHTSKFVGLASELLLSDMMTAGQNFCENDWSSIRKKHPSTDDEDLLRICFSSAYIVAFLHDSLGISLNDRSTLIVWRTCPLIGLWGRSSYRPLITST
ncbi:hypothetical protein OROHE_008732 [Orobanche hederae]